MRHGVEIWPGLETVVSVRFRGVDTLETSGPKCPEEKALADGTNVAGAILAAGHGRPYAGGRRESWGDPP